MLDKLRALHQPREGDNPTCKDCEDDWPCAYVELLSRLDAAEALNADSRPAMPPHRVTPVIIQIPPRSFSVLEELGKALGWSGLDLDDIPAVLLQIRKGQHALENLHVLRGIIMGEPL